MLTEGVRPNGVQVAPVMRYNFFKILTPGDLDAIVVYLKTIGPVSNEVPTPLYKAVADAVMLPGADISIGSRCLLIRLKGDSISRRLRIAWRVTRTSPRTGKISRTRWGKGGYEMKGPFGSVIVPNVSSHKEQGVGAWTDFELKRVLTEGIGRHGRVLPATNGAPGLLWQHDGPRPQRHRCLGT